MFATSDCPHYASLCVVVAAFYIVLQRSFRFKRIRTFERRYASLSHVLCIMTDTQAQEIQANIAQLEFPFLYQKSLEFALFRTYGIPSISKLLMQTQQLSTGHNAAKRYADTGVVLNEIFGNKPTDPRAIEAFGRLNYVHGLYRKSGKILDDDMLYTLSLFAWEPIKWIKRYEWRGLTPLEVCAIGTFIKSMGDAMDISYDVLPSSKSGWKDGIHWLSELGDWTEDYEKRNMVPHEDNHATAEHTIDILVRVLPASLRTVAKQLVIVLMDDRLRKAMIYDVPPHRYRIGLQDFLYLRKWFLRYLAVPRPEFLQVRTLTDEADTHGRYNLAHYDSFPFYVRPTLINRWGPTAWIRWAVGVPLPGDDGDKYQPRGYKIEDVGPTYLVGKGSEESKATRAKLAKERTGGCPFRMMST